MDIIGKLPRLEVLKLKDFAFCGSKWEPKEWGFRGLKVLLISRSDLKHWNASADHFPVLERLVLKYCWELKQIPIDFANIETLKSIDLESCYSFLVTSANKIEQKLSMHDRKLYVHDLGTKVGLPNNECFEEESAELPKNELSEVESAELKDNSQLVPSYLGSLVYLHKLKKLKFEIGRVDRFLSSNWFSKKLTLRYTYLPWKEMGIIGKLPHLEVLKLKDFAFFGSKWEPSNRGFQKSRLTISRFRRA